MTSVSHPSASVTNLLIASTGRSLSFQADTQQHKRLTSTDRCSINGSPPREQFLSFVAYSIAHRVIDSLSRMKMLLPVTTG
jgi:hypothetical protein